MGLGPCRTQEAFHFAGNSSGRQPAPSDSPHYARLRLGRKRARYPGAQRCKCHLPRRSLAASPAPSSLVHALPAASPPSAGQPGSAPLSEYHRLPPPVRLQTAVFSPIVQLQPSTPSPQRTFSSHGRPATRTFPLTVSSLSNFSYKRPSHRRTVCPPNCSLNAESSHDRTFFGVKLHGRLRCVGVLRDP